VPSKTVPMMRGVSNMEPNAARRATRNAALILIAPAPLNHNRGGLLSYKRGAWASVAFAVQRLGACGVIERGKLVPVLSKFDGITIEFYPSEHPPPHFHARYAEFIAQVNIRTGVVMNGSLPVPQMRKVVNWMSSRQDKLIAAWVAVGEGRKPEKIND
jgi:Domain of unknown function (DUF4160)